MDSVITQVAPPGQQPQQHGANAPAAPAAAAAAPSNASSASATTSGGNATYGNAVNHENDAAAAAANLSYNVQKGTKKRGRRNFLCSLICCLGKKRESRRRNKERDGSAAAAAAGAAGGGDVGDLAATAALSGSGGGGSSSLGGGGGPLSPVGRGGIKHLLPELRAEHAGRKCIVIDLDETLVHSSFKPINNADFIVPVEIDGTIHQVYVLKRPHVDEFLCRMGELYECVLFTASLAKYADPVADLLDKWECFHSRLFRESCVFHRGNYVKDLGRLGRELHKIIIVDNSPASYIFHPDNAVPVSSWFDDMNDRELLDLIPFLENLSQADSVYGMLQAKFKGGGGNSLASNGNSSTDQKAS